MNKIRTNSLHKSRSHTSFSLRQNQIDKQYTENEALLSKNGKEKQHHKARLQNHRTLISLHQSSYHKNKLQQKDSVSLSKQKIKSFHKDNAPLELYETQQNNNPKQKYLLKTKKLVKRPILPSKNKEYQNILLCLDQEDSKKLPYINVQHSNSNKDLHYNQLLIRRPYTGIPQSSYQSSQNQKNQKNTFDNLIIAKQSNHRQQANILNIDPNQKNQMKSSNFHKFGALKSSPNIIQDCVQILQNQIIDKFIYKQSKNIHFERNSLFSEQQKGQKQNQQDFIGDNSSDEENRQFDQHQVEVQDEIAKQNKNIHHKLELGTHVLSPKSFEVTIKNVIFAGLGICSSIYVCFERLQLQSEKQKRYKFVMTAKIYSEMGIFWLEHIIPNQMMRLNNSIQQNLLEMTCGKSIVSSPRQKFQKQNTSHDKSILIQKNIMIYLKTNFVIDYKGLGMHIEEKTKNKFPAVNFENAQIKIGEEMCKKMSFFSKTYLENKNSIDLLFSQQNKICTNVGSEIATILKIATNLEIKDEEDAIQDIVMNKLRVLYVAIQKENKKQKKKNKSSNKISSRSNINDKNKNIFCDNSIGNKIESKKTKKGNQRKETMNDNINNSIEALSQIIQQKKGSKIQQYYKEKIHQNEKFPENLSPIIKYILLNDTLKPKHKLKTVIMKNNDISEQDNNFEHEVQQLSSQNIINSKCRQILQAPCCEENINSVKIICNTIYAEILTKYFMSKQNRNNFISFKKLRIPEDVMISLKNQLLISWDHEKQIPMNPKLGLNKTLRNITGESLNDDNIINRFFDKLMYEFIVRVRKSNCQKVNQKAKAYFITVSCFQVKKLYRQGLQKFYLLKIELSERNARTRMNQITITSFDVAKHFEDIEINLNKCINNEFNLNEGQSIPIFENQDPINQKQFEGDEFEEIVQNHVSKLLNSKSSRRDNESRLKSNSNFSAQVSQHERGKQSKVHISKNLTKTQKISRLKDSKFVDNDSNSQIKQFLPLSSSPICKKSGFNVQIDNQQGRESRQNDGNINDVESVNSVEFNSHNLQQRLATQIFKKSSTPESIQSKQLEQMNRELESQFVAPFTLGQFFQKEQSNQKQRNANIEQIQTNSKVQKQNFTINLNLKKSKNTQFKSTNKIQQKNEGEPILHRSPTQLQNTSKFTKKLESSNLSYFLQNNNTNKQNELKKNYQEKQHIIKKSHIQSINEEEQRRIQDRPGSDQLKNIIYSKLKQADSCSVINITNRKKQQIHSLGKARGTVSFDNNSSNQTQNNESIVKTTNMVQCLKIIASKLKIYKTQVYSRIGIESQESAKVQQSMVFNTNKFRFSRNKYQHRPEQFLSPHLKSLQVLFQKTTKIACDNEFAIMTVLKVKRCHQFYIKIYVPQSQKTMSLSISHDVFNYFTKEELRQIFEPYLQLNFVKKDKKNTSSVQKTQKYFPPSQIVNESSKIIVSGEIESSSIGDEKIDEQKLFLIEQIKNFLSDKNRQYKDIDNVTSSINKTMLKNQELKLDSVHHEKAKTSNELSAFRKNSTKKQASVIDICPVLHSSKQSEKTEKTKKQVWNRILKHIHFARRYQNVSKQRYDGKKQNYLIAKLGEFEGFVKNFSVEQYIYIESQKFQSEENNLPNELYTQATNSIIKVEISMQQKNNGLNFNSNFPKEQHESFKGTQYIRKFPSKVHRQSKWQSKQSQLLNKNKVSNIKKQFSQVNPHSPYIYQSQANKKMVFVQISNTKNGSKVCYSYYLCELLHLVDHNSLTNVEKHRMSQSNKAKSGQFNQIFVNYAVLNKVLNYIKNQYIIELQDKKCSYSSQLFTNLRVMKQLKNKVDCILLDSYKSPKQSQGKMLRGDFSSEMKAQETDKLVVNLLSDLSSSYTVGSKMQKNKRKLNKGMSIKLESYTNDQQKLQGTNYLKIIFNLQIQRQNQNKLALLIRKPVSRSKYPVSCVFYDQIQKKFINFISHFNKGIIKEFQIPIQNLPMPFISIAYENKYMKNNQNEHSKQANGDKNYMLAFRHRLRKFLVNSSRLI